jgi:tetratricopeptide (TPR) repeat protein
MSELRILLARSEQGLTCAVGLGPARVFVPFLAEEDHKDLRWYLEDYLDLPVDGGAVRARRVEQALPRWGQGLFEAAFGPEGARALPDVVTIATGDVEALRLPWELLANAKGPLCQQGVTIRRALASSPAPAAPEAGALPLRILLVVSRPDDRAFIDPRLTTGAMLEALAPLGAGVRVDFCRPPTLDRLEAMLRDAETAGSRYQIVHFDGHGAFAPELQSGALLFEREVEGSTLAHEVRADVLGARLSAHRIPLLILEACHSGQAGQAGAFRGVAQALVEAGVGSVVAMSHAVRVEATRILVGRLYAALAAGRSIGAALEEGRAALAAQPERGPVALQDWFLPQLYQNSDDAVLVEGGLAAARGMVAAEVRRPLARAGEPGAFPGAPKYGFFGRAEGLARLERRLLRERAVVLHAMGGMGKTSLACEAARWLTTTGQFPDGAVFVSFEQPGGARRAVTVLGAYFEGVGFEKHDEEEQRRRARALFQEKKVLVVWDNFESALPAFQAGEAVPLYGDEDRAEIYALFASWMEEDPGAGRLLVTCRPEETGFPGAFPVELERLAQPEALSLLRRVMEAAGVTPPHAGEALLGLLEALDMHPLSIELVGPHLRTMTPEQIVGDFGELWDSFQGEPEEGRNRSLRASLEFSLKRLTPEAREAASWLGLFRGGVFEDNLLEISQLEPPLWGRVRRELVAIALVSLEGEIAINGGPFLRFHPALALALGGRARDPETRQRYVGVYLAMMRMVDEALGGPSPRDGLEIMALEEANFRRAVAWALEDDLPDAASIMGATVAAYLHHAGRLREWHRWVAWLAAEVRRGGFGRATADREIDAARALLSQGRPAEAIEKLTSLTDLLRQTTDFDAAFALADATHELGRTYVAVGLAQKAIPVLKEAVGQWEALIEAADSAGKSGEAAHRNLGVTWGDLANALRNVGDLDTALEAAEQSLRVCRERGARNVAAALAQIAQILEAGGHYAEADARYEAAVQVAELAGDRELQGSLLQGQGTLAWNRGQLERALQLCGRALHVFEEIQDEGSILRTCNLLGAVEQRAGRLAGARAWYERSRRLAKQRGDWPMVGVAAHNLGTVCQQEALALRTEGAEDRARDRLGEAARHVEEALRLKLEAEDEPEVADACVQLAQIHLLLGEPEVAERHVVRGLEIQERLGLNNARYAYRVLAQLAQRRNDPTAVAAWEQKHDTLLADLEDRAGPAPLTDSLVEAIAELALHCAQQGEGGEPLDPEAEENLAALATHPAPLDALPPFLRALARGEEPGLPPDLPDDLAAALDNVLLAVRENR